MILVGIDDTDTFDSRGTNQLAKSIVRQLALRWNCTRIVRHQLLEDPRIPCTSKNGSASLFFPEVEHPDCESVFNAFRIAMLDDFLPESDPGLAVATAIDPKLIDWGHRCQRELVEASEAYALAEECGVLLEGLGGTNGGVIGALAAIGLAAENNDGRVVYLSDFPDDLPGKQSVGLLREHGIDVRLETGENVSDSEIIDVGKKLRPNRVLGKTVLWAERTSSGLTAIKKV